MVPLSAVVRKPAVWERAEDFKRNLEAEYEAKEKSLEETARPEPTLVTVKEAVARFLNSKRNENLADSTLDKLTTIFEKQFLAWDTSYGFTHIAVITIAGLEGFRDTWTDGPPREEKETGAIDRRRSRGRLFCAGRPLPRGSREDERRQRDGSCDDCSSADDLQ